MYLHQIDWSSLRRRPPCELKKKAHDTIARHAEPWSDTHELLVFSRTL